MDAVLVTRVFTSAVLMTTLRSLQATTVNSSCVKVELNQTDAGYTLTIADCASPPTNSEIENIIAGYGNITEVSITNAKLDVTPDIICQHTEIRSLNLSQNLFSVFPACLYAMRQLEVLDLSHNLLREVEGHDVSEMRNLSSIFLAYNLIKEVTFDAWVALNMYQVNVIKLNHNRITSLPHDIISLHFDHLQQLDLSYNNFICDCQDKWMKPWLQSLEDKLLHKYEIMCSNSATGGPFPLLKITDMDNKFTCDSTKSEPPSKYSKELNTILISFLVIVIVLPFIAGAVVYGIWKKRRWIFYKTRWHPFDVDNCITEDKQYDVFISCAHQDEEWCKKYVIEFLEERNYKICWHREHFRPGEPVMNSVGRCIDESKRTLCILSKDFTNSPLCMRELETAIAVDFEKNRHRTVIIKFQDVNTSEFEPHVERFLRTITYIERGSKHFYDNLMYALPTKTVSGLVREYDVVVREDIPLEECTA